MIAPSPTTPAATPAGTGATAGATTTTTAAGAAPAATVSQASPNKPTSFTAAAVSSFNPDRSATNSGGSGSVPHRNYNARFAVTVEEEQEVGREGEEGEGGGEEGGEEEGEEEGGGGEEEEGAGGGAHRYRRPARRKPTVDAATQYSRPATPSDPLVTATAGSTAELQLSTPLSSMPATTTTAVTTATATATAAAVRGSKRNTPDAGATSAPTRLASSLTSQPVDRRSSGGIADVGADGHDRHGNTESASKRLRPTQPSPKVLARRYEDVDIRDLVVLISSMLMELIRFNDPIPLQDGRLTRFHSRSPPRISVQDYLQRLATHASLSRPILLSMVYYIDRLCALYPAFTISSLTVHRFLISSATVASKGLSDSFLTNQTYARVGGISVAELALLELEFLWRVEWRIVPKPEVLADYYRSLVERCDDYVIETGTDCSQDQPAVMNGVNDDLDTANVRQP